MNYNMATSERQGAAIALQLAYRRDQRYASAIAEIRDIAKGELTRLLDEAEARDYDPPAPGETVTALEDIIAVCDEAARTDEDAAATDAAETVESYAQDRTIRSIGTRTTGVMAGFWLIWWEAEHRAGRA